uniref:Uncharacterized protein n=1 Tax=Romanomermis culicivorax TaxID=13658 RepID=A0A915J8Z7_ROMCU
MIFCCTIFTGQPCPDYENCCDNQMCENRKCRALKIGEVDRSVTCEKDYDCQSEYQCEEGKCVLRGPGYVHLTGSNYACYADKGLRCPATYYCKLSRNTCYATSTKA